MAPDTKKLSRIKRIRSWLNRHRRATLIVSGIILIVVTAGVAWFLYMRAPQVGTYTPEPATVTKPEPEPVFYAPLTGAEVKNEAATTKPVTAIMIENSPDARPQSGLKKSEVVYEAIAEGGITRFLVMYQQEKPSLIGPVRSLRSYYVDWLAPYDASVAHVGGSAAALREIRNGNYRDIDQFFNAGTYWRATDRYAPHNVYTNFKNLDALNAQKGYKTSNPATFERGDTKAAEKPTATNISVTMSGPWYDSSYVYDKKSNTYKRSQAGAPHVDREDGQISPRVVIVIKSPMSLVQEDGLRQHYKTTGSGEATIFQDGTATKATWNKSTRSEQLVFKNTKGEVIKLARGQTWISVVPAETGGVSWQ